MRKIKRTEPGPTREEIIMRHNVIKSKNGDFSIQYEADKMGDCDILRELIRDAHHRIDMYRKLDSGLWHNIFNTNSDDAIREEEEHIATWERMILEINVWTKRKAVAE